MPLASHSFRGTPGDLLFLSSLGPHPHPLQDDDLGEGGDDDEGLVSTPKKGLERIILRLFPLPDKPRSVRREEFERRTKDKNEARNVSTTSPQVLKVVPLPDVGDLNVLQV